MEQDKCFCHFGGFAVKDAYAREKIQKMEENPMDNIVFATDEDIDAMFEGTGWNIPIEVATEEEMDALLETAAVGAVYKYVGETTDKYENGVQYQIFEK